MILKCRLTHDFVEIKADEIETTIFKSSQGEIKDTILNLLDVIEDLNKLIGKDSTNESKNNNIEIKGEYIYFNGIEAFIIEKGGIYTLSGNFIFSFDDFAKMFNCNINDLKVKQ